jgi:hypothetical protein
MWRLGGEKPAVSRFFAAHCRVRLGLGPAPGAVQDAARRFSCL